MLLLRNDTLHRVLTQLEQDLTRRWTRAELARTAGVSQSHFARLWKGETGLPLAAYVKQRRLSAAAERLRTTRESVKEIAAAVGFVSESHFNRSFKGLYGKTPVQHRVHDSEERSE